MKTPVPPIASRLSLFAGALFFVQLAGAPAAWGIDAFEAGRRWAEREELEDPQDCTLALPWRWHDEFVSHAESFTEGCLEYLREEGIADPDDEMCSEDDLDGDSSTEDDEDSDDRSLLLAI